VLRTVTSRGIGGACLMAAFVCARHHTRLELDPSGALRDGLITMMLSCRNHYCDIYEYALVGSLIVLGCRLKLILDGEYLELVGKYFIVHGLLISVASTLLYSPVLLLSSCSLIRLAANPFRSEPFACN
jgi:hypothetical protein